MVTKSKTSAVSKDQNGAMTGKKVLGPKVAARKITYQELLRMIADPAITDKDLLPYFTIDSVGEAPYSPQVRVNEALVENIPPGVGARGGWLVSQFNQWARARRERAFHDKLANGYAGPILVSEGDSWFQYPLLLDDVIDCLSEEFAVFSLDAAGDTLEQMIAQDEYMNAIVGVKADCFLISGGGNDLLGHGRLKHLLRDFDENLSPVDHIVPAYDDLVRDVISKFHAIFRRVRQEAPGVRVLCHTYDAPIPNVGQWLGQPMAEREITDGGYQRDIAAEIIRRFSVSLRELAQAHPHVGIVPTLGSVNGAWYDELHPDNSGFKAVTQRFRSAILSGGRSIARTTKAKPKMSAVGYSLHIGINEVDRKAYEGWRGELQACENDATAMAEIAADLRYKKTTVLRTKEATRDRVIDAITGAAEAMRPSDIFWLSYSGHGSQEPDFDGDERDKIDETWCLYDGMMLDDELYGLWAKFPPRSRIVVIADCCHSGSVVRAGPPGAIHREPALLTDQPLLRVKAMPPQIAASLFRKQRRAGVTRRPDAGGFEKSADRLIQCSVRLISGCQDEQFSYDGPVHGAFTARFLTVWGSGGYRKPYTDFYKDIRKGMPAEQLPAHFKVGASSAAFDAQSPFEV